MRAGSSYAYFYRWRDPSLTAANFAQGVTYARAAALGHRVLLMDLNAEVGHNYAGEYKDRPWIAHGRLRRVNVGCIDGSVVDLPAEKAILKYPAGSFEELEWFADANRETR